MEVRLQKFLADAGVASRRASEQVILAGRVTINGKVVKELGTKVDPHKDHVSVDGRALKAKRKLYLAVHKPRGYICSRNDPEGRASVSELLPLEWSNLYSVGRLDYNSEGLIFYTNDGDFALRLTHPRYGVRKVYRASVTGQVTPEMATALTKGVFHEGDVLKAEQIRILKTAHGHTLVEVILREGKNREVRRLFETQNLAVEKLQRTQIGPVKLGELPKGKWRTLTGAEIKSLISSAQ